MTSIQVISERRKQEIIVAFQATFKRDNSAEIEGLPLSDIKDTDAMLGDRDLNAGYRIAMRNRIADSRETRHDLMRARFAPLLGIDANMPESTDKPETTVKEQ